MGYKYVCNELYEYLISDDIKKDILFLTDDQFRDESIDLSDVDGRTAVFDAEEFVRPHAKVKMASGNRCRI